ncbi:hypothetical protein [Sphingomonas adhaesiva]|uniref:hypothetical protein n=1 Tax=Sphingomonas adhaesiva TaxID=28212 RepID=UPI002FFBC04D
MVTPLPSAPPMTPGWYICVRREAAGRDIEDVALALATEPPVKSLTRAAYLRTVEAGVQPATIDLAFALQRELRTFRVDVLFALVNVANGWLDVQFLPPICAVCGFSTRGIDRERCGDCGAAQR